MLVDFWSIHISHWATLLVPIISQAANFIVFHFHITFPAPLTKYRPWSSSFPFVGEASLFLRDLWFFQHTMYSHTEWHSSLVFVECFHWSTCTVTLPYDWAFLILVVMAVNDIIILEYSPAHCITSYKGVNLFHQSWTMPREKSVKIKLGQVRWARESHTVSLHADQSFLLERTLKLDSRRGSLDKGESSFEFPWDQVPNVLLGRCRKHRPLQNLRYTPPQFSPLSTLHCSWVGLLILSQSAPEHSRFYAFQPIQLPLLGKHLGIFYFSESFSF